MRGVAPRLSLLNAHTANMNDNWLDKVNWTQDGLVPAVAQEAASGRVLTVAWMNREALGRTAQTGEAHYWSRSRRKLWRKGEESGHVQKVQAIRLDCDEDVILLEVEQVGRHRLSYRARTAASSSGSTAAAWVETDPVLKDPQEIYQSQAMIDADILQRLGADDRGAQARRSVALLRREPVREGRGRDPEEGRRGGGRDAARRQGR